MLTAIALAAVIFPMPGKYMYAVTTVSGAEAADDVWVYATARGIVTHEERRSSAGPISSTDQHFDEALYPNWYVGATDDGAPVYIWPLMSIRGPTWARLWVAGKRASVPIEYPNCVLVLDSGLTSAVMLPSLVRATDAHRCTFIARSGAVVGAAIDTDIPQTRPQDAKASDLALTADIGNIKWRLWYDPKTLIPDYIDLGKNGKATLSASTLEQ